MGDMHETLYRAKNDEPDALIASPLIEVNEDVVLERSVCAVPKEYVQVYYEGPARTMVDDDRAPFLVGKAIDCHRDNPGRLAILTASARADWAS